MHRIAAGDACKSSTYVGKLHFPWPTLATSDGGHGDVGPRFEVMSGPADIRRGALGSPLFVCVSRPAVPAVEESHANGDIVHHLSKERTKILARGTAVPGFTAWFLSQRH